MKDAQRNIMMRELEYVIRLATGNYRIELIDKKDFVIIDHGNGTAQRANVECGSPLEMAYDIMKSALHDEYFDYDPSKEDETDED